MGHKRDWSKYNKELVNRGKIHFWIDPNVLKIPTRKRKKNGRPFVYGNQLIKAMSYIRFKFNLSLRETQGFFQSLQGFLPNQVPCYTQLCRRTKTLKVSRRLLAKRGVTDIVLDASGLKVYGEGEWRAQKYGGKKGWRKLHVAMDPKSGKLTMVEVTAEHVHDTTYLEKALRTTNDRQGRVLIDGIADSRRCYALARRYNKRLITPPKKGAIFREEEEFEGRNEAIRVIRGFGGDLLARSIWAKSVGYSRRVIVESMISRWKRVLGDNLRSRCEKRRKVEVQLKAQMINAMIDGRAA